jgi:hypothetical protein
MRQGDGTDLLGPSDPRGASIGVIYVAPNDDRQSVLTAILTQDKLGFKQVVVVLPDLNRAFQRPVDFDGLKNMRRGLKAEIVFIAPSGPGPAEFARHRRFPVYSSLESFSQSIKLESIVSGTVNGSTKSRFFGFGRKHELAATVAVASVSGIRIEEENTSPLPVNEAVITPRDEPYSDKPDEDLDEVGEKNGSNGLQTKNTGKVGLAAGAGIATLADDQNSSSGIITFSSNAPRSKITRKFPVPPAEVVAVPIVAAELLAQTNGTNTAPPVKRGNSGEMAAVVGGATAAGVGAVKVGSVASGGGGLPPNANTPGGPGGGGVGGTSRQTPILLAIFLGVLTVLLIGGITIAAIPGGINSIAHVIPGVTTTATVTITPDSQDLSNTFQILGVTGTPNPSLRQVPAHILTSTSQALSKNVTSTGSIPGTRATGLLTFSNPGNFDQTFNAVILKGHSGVPVSFNGPITVPAAIPASATVTGFAVNIGSAGNIGPLDITGSCCATGITVKNGAFSGGQNPQPNSVVLQSDINGAADALTATLTTPTQAALQKQVQPGEQIVANTLQCNKSTFTANHVAGDHASNVTVTVAITCKEEVYNQPAALTMGTDLLKKQASTALGPNYALTGSIVTEVTKVMVIDSRGTLSILVKAEGVWVYQFSDTVQQDLKTQIQNKPEQDAINYLKAQPGVKDVMIEITNGGTTLPDTANIKIEIVPISGTTGTPTAGPTGAVTPPVTPTST